MVYDQYSDLYADMYLYARQLENTVSRGKNIDYRYVLHQLSIFVEIDQKRKKIDGKPLVERWTDIINNIPSGISEQIKNAAGEFITIQEKHAAKKEEKPTRVTSDFKSMAKKMEKKAAIYKEILKIYRQVEEEYETSPSSIESQEGQPEA